MQILSMIDGAARFAEGFVKAGVHPFTTAVILAGGTGSRMKQDLPPSSL